MERCASLSSRLMFGRAFAVGDVGDFNSLVERLLRSSNLGRITMFGSPGTGMASMTISRPKLLARDAAMDARRGFETPFRLLSLSSMAYSAKC